METVEEEFEETNLQGKGVESGATYIRWGSTSCPEGTLLLYEGRAGTTYFSDVGGAVDYLCMPDEPEYDLSLVRPLVQGFNFIYGVEYKFPAPDSVQHNQNVPCAACFAQGRVSHIMIPGRLSCPKNWNSEYTGFIMSSAWYKPHVRTSFVCVDRSLESVRGEGANQGGGYLYNVEVKCDYGIDCPPYSRNRELMCVVCTHY